MAVMRSKIRTGIRPGSAAAIAALLALVALISTRSLFERHWPPLAGDIDTIEAAAPAVFAPAGDAAIAAAFRERASGLVVESRGVVERVLRDDLSGDRHQRFVLRLASGQTLLVSHNVDLAPRVPVAPGDSVEFSGEYVWKAEGGVVHWTHRDPEGLRPGGWLRHRGELYR